MPRNQQQQLRLDLITDLGPPNTWAPTFREHISASTYALLRQSSALQRALSGQTHGQYGLDTSLGNRELLGHLLTYYSALRSILLYTRQMILGTRGAPAQTMTELWSWNARFDDVGDNMPLHLALMRALSAATDDWMYLSAVWEGEISGPEVVLWSAPGAQEDQRGGQQPAGDVPWAMRQEHIGRDVNLGNSSLADAPAADTHHAGGHGANLLGPEYGPSSLFNSGYCQIKLEQAGHPPQTSGSLPYLGIWEGRHLIFRLNDGLQVTIVREPEADETSSGS